MTLEELYKVKGELVTQLEITQAKLKQINQEIIAIMNKQAQQPKPTQFEITDKINNE